MLGRLVKQWHRLWHFLLVPDDLGLPKPVEDTEEELPHERPRVGTIWLCQFSREVRFEHDGRVVSMEYEALWELGVLEYRRQAALLLYIEEAGVEGGEEVQSLPAPPTERRIRRGREV